MPHTPKSKAAHDEDVNRLKAQQDRQYRELAGAIAAQAQAIADGTVQGPLFSQVVKISANVATLKAWTKDDRNHGTPESTKHDYQAGDGRSAMQTDPLCRVCHEPKRSAVHN